MLSFIKDDGYDHKIQAFWLARSYRFLAKVIKKTDALCQHISYRTDKDSDYIEHPSVWQLLSETLQPDLSSMSQWNHNEKLKNYKN